MILELQGIDPGFVVVALVGLSSILKPFLSCLYCVLRLPASGSAAWIRVLVFVSPASCVSDTRQSPIWIKPLDGSSWRKQVRPWLIRAPENLRFPTVSKSHGTPPGWRPRWQLRGSQAYQPGPVPSGSRSRRIVSQPRL